jgi:hypothetical protein
MEESLRGQHGGHIRQRKIVGSDSLTTECTGALRASRSSQSFFSVHSVISVVNNTEVQKPNHFKKNGERSRLFMRKDDGAVIFKDEGIVRAGSQ